MVTKFERRRAHTCDAGIFALLAAILLRVALPVADLASFADLDGGRRGRLFCALHLGTGSGLGEIKNQMDACAAGECSSIVCRGLDDGRHSLLDHDILGSPHGLSRSGPWSFGGSESWGLLSSIPCTPRGSVVDLDPTLHAKPVLAEPCDRPLQRRQVGRFLSSTSL